LCAASLRSPTVIERKFDGDNVRFSCAASNVCGGADKNSIPLAFNCDTVLIISSVAIAIC
jgi:hypothetical protein